MTNDIRQRKGRIKFSSEFIRKKASEEFMRKLFAVFYPMGIVDEHIHEPYDTMTYFGVSPLFDIVKEGDLPPQYNCGLVRIGNVEMIKMEKV